jgi:heat shock protein HtpX
VSGSPSQAPGTAAATAAAGAVPPDLVRRAAPVLAHLGGAAVAVGLIAVAVTLVVQGLAALSARGLDPRVPVWAFWAVLALPPIAFAICAVTVRRIGGMTFQEQARANRRASVVLLVAMILFVAAVFEIVGASVTLTPEAGLVAAGAGGIVGLVGAFVASRSSGSFVLHSAGAHPADPVADKALLDVVAEVSLAAGIPTPATYVIEDDSENAFSTGSDAAHASVAVTRGLLSRLDREELQGVIGHELGHVRNLDIRFGLYVAVLVGIVAFVADGFLHAVLQGWARGAFFWRGSGKNAGSALAAGLLFGLFLLAVSAVVYLVAPLCSALVQAASSRQREFLADTTSVEFTRNPRALERALSAIAGDTDPLEAANRGTQHLWFRNPVKAGGDGRPGIFSTHPSFEARIDRLRALEGLAPLAGPDAQKAAEEA